MPKKSYFILSPASSLGRTEELRTKAAAYYGSKDYEPVSERNDLKELSQRIIKELANVDCNASLLLTGLTAVAMSKCNSVYVSNDWSSDDLCKFCHMLAFSHGLDLVYEE